MKSSKNNITRELFEEISELLIQSVSLSGNDEIVKSVYRCEQYFNKCTIEERVDVLLRLHDLSVKNMLAFSDNKTESFIWNGILDAIKKALDK